MEKRRMALVSKFVNSLMSYYKVEFSEAIVPIRVAQVALDEIDTWRERAKAFLGEFMHSGGKINRNIVDIALPEQLFGQESGARTQLQHPASPARAGLSDYIGERGKKLRSPRAPGHCGISPCARILGTPEIEADRHIFNHVCNPKKEVYRSKENERARRN
jgi:hypothetical protein